MSDFTSYQTDLSDYQSNLLQYQNLLSTLNDKQSNIRDTVDSIAPIALDYALRKGPGYIGGAVGKLFGKEAGQKAEAAVTRVVSNKGGLVEGLKAEANTVVGENLPANLQPLANAAISGDTAGLKTAATNLASNVINENVPSDLQPLANAALSGDTSTLTSAASNLVQPVVNQATSAVENLTTQANNLVGQVTGQVSELSTQAGNLVSQASGQVDSLTNQLTNQASDLADQGFRTGRVLGSLQDSATSGWGSDGTLARALNGDRLPPNVRARIGQGQQIYNDLFGNEQTATVPTQPTPDIPEEAISARPAVNYNQPEEFVTPKSAPGASTEMTSFAGDTAATTPAVSDLAAPTAAAALEGDVPTVISSAASGLAAAGGEIGADIGSTVLGTLGGLTEGLLDTPLAPLAIFTGLGAILDKVFEHKTPVFNPSKPEFQSGF